MKKTLLKSIEERYGVDFGVPMNMSLTRYLEKAGLPSLGSCFLRIKRTPVAGADQRGARDKS
jgi:hypothetical protein